MATDHLSGASFNVLRMLPFCGVLVNDLAAAAQILIRVCENYIQWLSRYARGHVSNAESVRDTFSGTSFQPG